MTSDTRVFVYVGSFADADAAVHAIAAAETLHKDGKLRLVEAGAFLRTPSCDVKMLKTVDPAIGKGAGIGLMTGALVGLLFPPALLSVPVDAAAGAALGAVVATFNKEFGRATIKALGDQLDAGEAGVFVVAKDVAPHVTSLMVLPGAQARVRQEVDDPKALASAIEHVAAEPELSKAQRKAAKAAKAAKKAAKASAKAARKSPKKPAKASAASNGKASRAKKASKPSSKKAAAR